MCSLLVLQLNLETKQPMLTRLQESWSKTLLKNSVSSL
uniref:Uncharacterized protein n=1 Tax=Arundo donax TaxID=35708 RepID=A0A0A9FRL4_ARUDO